MDWEGIWTLVLSAGLFLFAALAREGDGYAFSCLHQSLQVLSGKQVLLLAGEEDDPQARARIVREWKEKLSS